MSSETWTCLADASRSSRRWSESSIMIVQGTLGSPGTSEGRPRRRGGGAKAIAESADTFTLPAPSPRPRHPRRLAPDRMMALTHPDDLILARPQLIERPPVLFPLQSSLQSS